MTNELLSYWEEFADLWDELQGESGDALRHKVILPWLLCRLPDVQGHRILDVGCGNGAMCRVLTRLGAECIGLDGSRQMIELGLLRNEKSVRAPQLSWHDVRRELPLKPQVLDIAIVLFTLQDLEDCDGLVKELSKCLKPGGTLAVVLENSIAMEDMDIGRRTRRVNLDPNVVDIYGFSAQRIIWEGRFCTITFPRPIEFYDCLFARNNFRIRSTEVLEPYICSDSEDTALTTPDKFLGIILEAT